MNSEIMNIQKWSTCKGGKSFKADRDSSGRLVNKAKQNMRVWNFRKFLNEILFAKRG